MHLEASLRVIRRSGGWSNSLQPPPQDTRAPDKALDARRFGSVPTEMTPNGDCGNADTDPIAAPHSRPAASRRLAEHQIGRLLVLPALIFAILVTQAPFLLTIWYSLQRWNLNRPERRAFVGLDNYVFLLTRDPAFLEAILNTVVFVVGAVFASLVLGLLYAELVNHRFPGRGIVRTMLITPFLIMPAAAALTWKNQLLEPKLRRRRLGDQHRAARKSRVPAGSTSFRCSR